MAHINLAKIVCFSLSLAVSPVLLFAGETDPLSPAEQDKALLISTAQAPLQQRISKGTESSATSLPTPETELLLIERRQTDKEATAQRLADVYHYDYTHDETIHSVVNLDTRQLLSRKRHQYLQLPLNNHELQRSRDIIFADPEQAVLISKEYQRITGQHLQSPEQLNIKAFTFSADTLPEQLNPASQQCGLHRCAQVLLYTHDSVVFEISPIVNLSAGMVTQNIGY